MIEHRSVDLAGSRLAGNTWGMSGPQFLGWYVVFSAGAIGAMIVLLQRITDDDHLPAMDVSTLSTMQIAVLNGAAVPAVVALVELRSARADRRARPRHRQPANRRRSRWPWTR